MSRTTAPLLSFEAQGQIAKSLVYGKWRGVRYARRYVIPANPRTAGQSQTRETFAMLREMWKLAPSDVRAPWDAFAKGRPFLGLNAFVGENVRVLRVPTDMDNFIGSPGAKGGIPATSMNAAAGGSSGEIDATFVLPTPPTDWTATSVVAMAFPDQDPHADFAGLMVVGSETPPTLVVTLAGLGSAVACQVAGWVVWTKPNGELAYSVGITDQATSAA